jgi:hypothetical protein
MQRARHLAAAARGGGALFSDANSNSKMARGDVTKRRRWVAIAAAMSGKLKGKMRTI